MAIAVVDYRKGNLLSVKRWIEACGYEVFVTQDPQQITAADAVVLPGVGSFKDASDTLVESGAMRAMRASILQGKPFLGICLGAQLLVESGNEGCEAGESAQGIGAFDGVCERLADVDACGMRFKVPHVGWNSLDFEGAVPCSLFDGIDPGSYFYFTHSYMLIPADKGCVAAYTTHAQRFACAIAKDNIFGLQFHPEKSSDLGLVIGRNFCRLVYGK